VDVGTDGSVTIGTTRFVAAADPLAIGAGVPLAFCPSLVIGPGPFAFDEDLGGR